MTNVTFTANQVNAASLSELRELAKINGITVRHPETKKPRTAAQYRIELLRLVPVVIEKPAKVASKAPKVAKPVTASGSGETEIILPLLDEAPVYPTKANCKIARFLDALRMGATHDHLKAIITESNQASVRAYIYYVCRTRCKSLGCVKTGSIYKLVEPSAA